MRVLVVLAVLAGAASAAADPLWEAELRMGYGVALGGGGGMTSARPTPLTLAATAAVAVVEEPAISSFGGLTVETLDRNSVGVVFGVRLAPRSSPVRLTAGGTWVFAPYTLWGATASGGLCRRSRGIGVCGDVQLTSYLAGTDLAAGHTVTQVQLVLGIVFDAR